MRQRSNRQDIQLDCLMRMLISFAPEEEHADMWKVYRDHMREIEAEVKAAEVHFYHGEDPKGYLSNQNPETAESPSPDGSRDTEDDDQPNLSPLSCAVSTAELMAKSDHQAIEKPTSTAIGTHESDERIQDLQPEDTSSVQKNEAGFDQAENVHCPYLRCQ